MRMCQNNIISNAFTVLCAILSFFHSSAKAYTPDEQYDFSNRYELYYDSELEKIIPNYAIGTVRIAHNVAYNQDDYLSEFVIGIEKGYRICYVKFTQRSAAGRYDYGYNPTAHGQAPYRVSYYPPSSIYLYYWVGKRGTWYDPVNSWLDLLITVYAYDKERTDFITEAEDYCRNKYFKNFRTYSYETPHTSRGGGKSIKFVSKIRISPSLENPVYPDIIIDMLKKRQ